MGVVQDREPPDGIVKHFTVAVFVVHRGHVLLHPHPKVGLWLPPGGHIEPHELPDDAAVRETLEETGLHVRLVGSPGIGYDAPGSPRQLLRPEGVQVEDITPGHQHIDLIYFAVPEGRAPGAGDEVAEGLEDEEGGLPQVLGEDGMRWVDHEAVRRLPVTDEVAQWVALALREVPRRLAEAGAKLEAETEIEAEAQIEAEEGTEIEAEARTGPEAGAGAEVARGG